MQKTIILLDLGGVLVDLGDPVRAMHLDMDNTSFWKLWLSSSLVQQFETGHLDATEFTAAFGAHLGIDQPGEFASRLQRWQLQVYAGAADYLRELSRHQTVALLSNTNEIHWQQVLSQTDVFADFAGLFLSYETGHAKPHTAAFLDVIDYFSCVPQAIAFFDDNADNVAAAAAVGMRAVQVRGIPQLAEQVEKVIEREI